MTIKELIERLEKAACQDRELDVAIAVAIDGYVLEKRERDRKLWLYREESGPRYYGRKDPEYGVSGEYPRLTSSIDATVALCERVLPEANCYGAAKDKTGWTAFVSRNNVASGHWLVEAEGPTAPIALLLAILRAKARLND